MKRPEPKHLHTITIRRMPEGKQKEVVGAVSLGGYSVFVTARGGVYWDRPTTRVHPYLMRHPRLIRALKSLGVATAESADAAIAEIDRRVARAERRRAAWKMREGAEALGIKLTKAQIAKLDRAEDM